MSTIKETQEQTVKTQLDRAVRDLIEVMDSESSFDIAIVEEDTKYPRYEFSIEYPPYEKSAQKFQPRVSNLEAEVFTRNVFDNIKDLLGYDYRYEDNFIEVFVPRDGVYSGQVGLFSNHKKLYFYKKIHIKIRFVE